MLDESIFRRRRLAIVGSICRDVKVAPLRPGPHLWEDGETPTAFIRETIGGGGANSALAAAALGADVRFGGKVGADPLGLRLEQSLVDCGVKTFIRRDPHVATGSSVVLSYDSGARHFVSCQRNNYSLTASDVDPQMLRDAGHLLRADVWFSEPMLAGGNQDLFAPRGSADCPPRSTSTGTRNGARRMRRRLPVARKRCAASCRWSTWSTATSAS